MSKDNYPKQPTQKFSAWAVFALSLINLVIYPIYFVTRSFKLNTIAINKISDSLIYVMVLVFVISLGGAFFAEIYSYYLILKNLDVGVDLLSTVFYLSVLFAFRSRLMSYILMPINPVLTYFLGPIYLQYKINKKLDQFQISI